MKFSNKRRKRDRTAGFLILFLSVFLIALVIALPQFHVKDISVTGLRVVSREEVINVVDIEAGDHILKGIMGPPASMFALRHSQREGELIFSNPYIKSAQIKSVFPSGIEITIEERIEIAFISITDGCVIIDSEGVALEIIEKDEVERIPVIKGVTVKKAELDKKVITDLPGYLDRAILLLNDIINADKDTSNDVKLFESVSEIRPVRDNNTFLSVVLPDSGEHLAVRIKNNDDALENLIWLRHAMDQAVLDDLGEGFLDLTTSQKGFIIRE